MKKVIIFIIAILIAGGLGFFVGMQMTKEKEEEADKKDTKLTIYNEHLLDYNKKFKVNDDGYVILDVIDSKSDYESFLEDYEKYDKNETDYKSYNKKYQYIMVGMEVDRCSEEISAKKYKVKKDTLILYVDVQQSCGLCAFDNILYEFAVPADLEFDDVEIEFNYIDPEKECPQDVAYKPVLYLYPEKEQEVTVKFAHPEYLTTTYPKYTNGWTVVAKPNGDLLANNKYYYALYWEELNQTHVDFSEGFYVTKDNAIEFLEEKLTTIGLNEKERNEFIMYWLPILEKNEQSLVYFELTESLQETNALNITPTPDSLLRVRIHVKKVDNKVNIKEQKLETFDRIGFTAVEWGGVTY